MSDRPVPVLCEMHLDAEVVGGPYCPVCSYLTAHEDGVKHTLEAMRKAKEFAPAEDVEAVARAIAGAGQYGDRWDSFSTEDQNEIRHMARAAIRAMRERGEQMDEPVTLWRRLDGACYASWTQRPPPQPPFPPGPTPVPYGREYRALPVADFDALRTERDEWESSARMAQQSADEWLKACTAEERKSVTAQRERDAARARLAEAVELLAEAQHFMEDKFDFDLYEPWSVLDRKIGAFLASARGEEPKP